MKPIKINIPIFQAIIDFRFSKIDEFKKEIEKDYNIAISDSCPKGAAALAFNLEKDWEINNTILIFVDDMFSHSFIEGIELLTHEIIHAVFMIYKNRDIDVTSSNDELVTYLSQFILSKVLKELKFDKIKWETL